MGLLTSHGRKKHRWLDAAGLKPVYGGSIPSFLVLGQKLVLQRCDMEVGSRGFIRHWSWLVLVVGLFVLKRKPLR